MANNKLNKISFMSQAHFDEMGSTEDQNISLVGGVAVAGTKKDVIPMKANTAATYTAPADGYVAMDVTNPTRFYILNTTTNIGDDRTISGPARMNVRVAKGDVCRLFYQAGTLIEAAFYYDK